jgi:hypothetical protein
LLITSIHGWLSAQASARSVAVVSPAVMCTIRHSGQVPWMLPTLTLDVPFPWSVP